MERLRPTMILTIFLEMEWNGNGKGMECNDIVRGMLPLEIFYFFVNSTWNRSIKFHSIPLNSTFHFIIHTKIRSFMLTFLTNQRRLAWIPKKL